ncbi:hypothetical protein [Kineococcus radiotolerans]|nr:hypothetical protein [Kineococcus radiotolerans]
MAQPGVPPYWESLHSFHVEGQVDDLAAAQCLADFEIFGLLVWDDAAQMGRLQVTPEDGIAMLDALPDDPGARI